MISFISWVNNQELYKDFKESARRFDCEFIVIGQDAKSMAQAYNLGTSAARGDILVYVHQDVRIWDENFDLVVKKALANKSVGWAGPIGNISLSNRCWWEVGPEQCRGWVIHKGDKIFNFGQYNGRARQLDGLMLCTKKRFTFPEKLPGIHFLDLWMCREAEQQGLYNWVFSSAIQHLSWGEIESEAFRINQKIYASSMLYIDDKIRC